MIADKDTKARKSSWNFVDMITNRIARITGLIVAVCALLGALSQLIGWPYSLFKISPGSKWDCLKMEMSYPERASVGNWDATDFRLGGQNDCKEKLGIHVAFKVIGGSVLIEPHNPDCGAKVLDDPDCWDEVYPLDRGKVDRRITPPRLTVLTDPSGESMEIELDWLVYNMKTRERLVSDKARVTLVNELSR